MNPQAWRDVVIISSIDWTRNWQMHQQLATSLVETGHRVLFVENTGVRPPRSGDMQRITSRLRNWLGSTKGFADVKPGLTIYSPLFIPLPYSKWALWANRAMLGSAIHDWMRSARFQPQVVISFLPTPLARELCKDLAPQVTVYYCANDMAGGSEGAAPLRELESTFMAEVQAVFCNAHALRDVALAHNPASVLFPAGVAFDTFAASAQSTEPAFLQGLHGRARLGYVGSISHVFDQDLVVQLAQSLPDVDIVCVGPLSADVSRLQACPNIHLLGPRPHSDIPAFLRHVDVGLIPYLVNDFSHAVYPCKLNEYLAVGLPVVSTAMREIVRFREDHGDVVRVAADAEAFVAEVALALKDQAPDRQQARVAAARRNSWAQRFLDMHAEIERLLASRAGAGGGWQAHMKALYQRTRLRALKWAGGGLLGYGLLFHTPLVWSVGQGLTSAAQPHVAQALVVFSGDGDPGYTNAGYQRRAQEALDLYRRGYAPRIVLVAGREGLRSEAYVVEALLRSGGVPASALQVLPKVPSSTRNLVLYTVAELRQQGIDDALLLTGPFHARRAEGVWRRAAPEIRVSTMPAQGGPEVGSPWRPSFKLLSLVTYEYLALVQYWWKGWL